MTRLLLIGIALIVVVSALFYFFPKKESPKVAASNPLPAQTDQIQFASSSATTTDQISSVENAITSLNQKVNQVAGNNLVTRVTNLETAVTNLQKEVNQPNPSTTPAPTVATKKPPLYIPLNWVGSSTSQSYTTLSTQQIKIDPADYPGYTSMQFEVSMRVYQGNGQAFARLFDTTNSTAVLSSEVNTTSEDYIWLSSNGFTLTGGAHTYALQLKTLTGYTTDVQSARIKINF